MTRMANTPNVIDFYLTLGYLVTTAYKKTSIHDKKQIQIHCAHPSAVSFLYFLYNFHKNHLEKQ